MFARFCIALAVAFTVVTAPSTARSCSIAGSISAEPANSPEFSGLWKYTIEVSWDTGAHGLSHASLFLALENLECRCHPGVVAFDTPAGTSTGEDCAGGTDPVLYEGEYACMGDPSIPQAMNAPAVKFDHPANPDCEPAAVGTGVFCFYTPFSPAPYTENPAGLAVKAGQDTCFGTLSGTPPLGDCAVPVESSSWGRIKALHR